jgi:hypothetical protein
VREQFLVEITGDPDDPSRHRVADLGELNRLFTAWVETIYHRQIHSETGQAPLTRWTAGGPFGLPTPDALAEAFLWEEHRTVTKTALVSLQATPTRSTRCWSGAASSWCSTRSTWPPSRSGCAASRPGPRSRTTSVGTPTSRPDPKPHPSYRHRPGSTTPCGCPQLCTQPLTCCFAVSRRPA